MSKSGTALVGWAVVKQAGLKDNVASAILDIGNKWAGGAGGEVIPEALQRHGVSAEEYNQAIEALKDYGTKKHGIRW